MPKGGILIDTERSTMTIISKLTLASVMEDDSGIYTCTTLAGSDSIQLHVIEGKKIFFSVWFLLLEKNVCNWCS